MGPLDGIRSIEELGLENQRIFIRADFDVPADEIEGSEQRVRAALPTIQRATSLGARVVLGAHRTRAPGRRSEELGLESFGGRLSELLGSDIYLPDDAVGDAARKVVQDLRPGQICLLENLAFHPEEEAGDEGFARRLAAFVDVYVNDAPRAARSTSASIALLPRLLRERAAGYAFRRELEAYSRLGARADRPTVAVLGGAQVAQKLAMLRALLGRVDAVCAGGALGNLLLQAQGSKLGASPRHPELLARARTLLSDARDRKVELLLPVDLVVADSRDARQGFSVGAAHVPDGMVALDVGPSTRAAFAARLATAKSVLFAGPLGVTENPAFAEGTLEVARAVAESAAFSVVNGESTAALFRAAGEDVVSKIGVVSTLGDVALDLFEGRRLPAVEALRGGAT